MLNSLTDASRQPHLLVVDDEEIIQDFLCEFLGQQGYRVTSADNGQEGLARIREARPDLVISDVNMPLMSGIELLQRLREIPDAPPVILLTGYADIGTAIEALKIGAHDYMLKPVQTDDLLNRVRNLLYIRQLETRSAEERRKSVYAARMAAVGQLAAGVAHEINNPTTFVRGNTQILQTILEQVRAARTQNNHEALGKAVDKLLEAGGDLLEGVERGTARIAQITHGLIHFSDAQSYEPQIPVDLGQCVKQALALWAHPEDGVDFLATVSEDLPKVIGNAGSLSQALICLLQNARQAVQDVADGQIRLTGCANGSHVLLMVEDSGSGIPSHLREQIFEPFFTTREVGQGAGLGLAVVYGVVVHDHGGEVVVGESELGGACFTIRLPAMQPVRSPSAPVLRGI